MPKSIGLYLHIPFCKKKCSYCDFYSAFTTDDGLDRYTEALINEIKRWGGSLSRPISTIYFGGGTPSLLGKRIADILQAVKTSFHIADDAEITAEVNPDENTKQFLEYAKNCGVNRLSIGLQSANDDELRLLGRQHTAKDAQNTVLAARELGFKNISLDLMLALPESTNESFLNSVNFALSLSPEHISAYILKLEPNTALSRRKDMNFADDETAENQYLLLSDTLKANGFEHYEISNFAKQGYESRHNLKYWNCEEYLGIGPAAHSFLEGERFYYPRDLQKFLKNPTVEKDGTGGDIYEKIMLALRLKKGFDFAEFPTTLNFLKTLEKNNFGTLCGTHFSLTARGMLVSNSIISEILERI